MFDNKDRKDDLSSDELELMDMIREYERDEAAEQLQEPEEPRYENTYENRYESVSDKNEDTALINRCDHTKVMSRDQLDDKTLTIMPVGNVKPEEESSGHTQNLDFSQLDEGAEDDDDPRFELHRKKDKKPKKKKDKKPKKGKKKDENLKKTVIITIVIALVIGLIATGFLVYNAFFKDKKADDDKITEVTKKTDKKKTTKKKKTEKKEEAKETPKDDHSAEIRTLQGLIDQERTKYNDYINQANTKQEQLNAYTTSLNTLQNKVADAQKAIDNAGGEENATDEMRTELKNAQENLANFLNKNPNPPTQSSIDELNRKARDCQDNITNYQNQIYQYQNS